MQCKCTLGSWSHKHVLVIGLEEDRDIVVSREIEDLSSGASRYGLPDEIVGRFDGRRSSNSDHVRESRQQYSWHLNERIEHVGLYNKRL